jgi:hypothetical protein
MTDRKGPEMAFRIVGKSRGYVPKLTGYRVVIVLSESLLEVKSRFLHSHWTKMRVPGVGRDVHNGARRMDEMIGVELGG